MHSKESVDKSMSSGMGNETKKLGTEIDVLKKRIEYLETITPKHANYFYSFFKGRTDVYSKRSGKPNPKTGKTGYYTVNSAKKLH